MTASSPAVARLQRRLTAVLVARQALYDLTGFAIVAGVVALVVTVRAWWFAALLPLVVAFAAIRAMRRVPRRDSLVALIDSESHCGGLLLAAETNDVGAWNAGAVAPDVRWNARRPLTFAACAVIFAIAAMLVPRSSANAAHHALDITADADRVAAQLQTMTEEKVLPPDRLDALQQSLEQLRHEASGDEPAKAWETLDALSDANARAAANAAEESLQKTEQLTRAEETASVLGSGALDAQDLAAGMRELGADLDTLAGDADLAAAMTPQMKQALARGTLSKEELQKLGGAARNAKDRLKKRLDRLSAAGLLDAKALARQTEAAEAGDRDALSAYLKEHVKKQGFSGALTSWRKVRGAAGVDRGRGDAPMFFGEQAAADGAKFQPRTLPSATAAALRDSQLVGMSAAAPGPADPHASNSGALAGAAAGNGSAFTPVILPRHRGTVKRYFERK
jgi:hypothetical protein